MKNLFFVAVATGIFSGTSLSVKAQSSVNMEQMNASIPTKKSLKFIDVIEINNTAVAVFNDATAANVIAAEKENEISVIEKCSSLQFKYALLLDMDVENVTNKVLFEEIDKWMDTRYRYGGTSEKGIDCSAYTGTLLADAYGLNVARTSREQYADAEKVEKEDLQQGDLVFFNTRGRRGGVSHVGLYLGNGYFTHSGSSTGVTISHIDETYWSNKMIGAGRFKAAPPAPKKNDLEIL